MQYVFAVLTPILSFLLGYLSTKFQKSKQEEKDSVKRKNEEQQVMNAALRALLKDRITSMYYTSAEKKYCRVYARENLEDMYKQYEALGGNGMVADLHNKIMKLPTEPSEERTSK